MSRQRKIFKMNDKGEILKDYDQIVRGGYVYNTPDILDQRASDDQVLSNYGKLDAAETSLQGYNFFEGDQTFNDYMLLAIAGGATNFLKANGFPNNLVPDYIPLLQNTISSFDYPVNINFQQVTPTSPASYSTPMPPMPTRSCPTCPSCPPFPTCQQCQQCQECEKITTAKQAYFSLLGALIFLLLSLPIIYRLTDVVFGSIGANTMAENGAPTYFGLFFHFAVYFLITFGLMKLFEKKKN